MEIELLIFYKMMMALKFGYVQYAIFSHFVLIFCCGKYLEFDGTPNLHVHMLRQQKNVYFLFLYVHCTRKICTQKTIRSPILDGDAQAYLYTNDVANKISPQNKGVYGYLFFYRFILLSLKIQNDFGYFILLGKFTSQKTFGSSMCVTRVSC